jgi:hypothetical protein
MPKMHFQEHATTIYPVCGVYDSCQMTNHIDFVTCRRCLKWEAHVRQDPSILDRLTK